MSNSLIKKHNLIRDFAYDDITIGDLLYIGDRDDEGKYHNLTPYKVVGLEDGRIDVIDGDKRIYNSNSKSAFNYLQKSRILKWKQHLQ